MTTGKATPFGSVSDFCTIRISLSLLSIFTADGNGGVSKAKLDVNEGGVLTSDSDFTMTYAVPDGSTTGRGTAAANISLGGPTTTLNFALYVVSAKEAFIVGSDPIA